MSLNSILQKLEYLAKKYFKKQRAIDRNGFYNGLQQVAEELVSDSSVGLKSRMQGLASCLAVFTRMRVSHKNQEMESADNVIKYLFLECARLLLGVEYANAKPNDLTISVFCNITKSCLKQHAGDITSCRYFEMLNVLTEDPWNSQQLFSVGSGNEMTNDAECINEVEHPELILLRIEILLSSECADMATQLINRLTQVKSSDVHLMSQLLFLLHNADQSDEFLKQCSNMSCCMACDVLRYVHETEKMYSQEAAVLLMSRTFLVRAWTEETDMSCTRVLLRYWLTLERHHLAEDETEFLLSVDRVLALAHSGAQLIAFIDVMESLFASLYLGTCMDVARRVLRSERHQLDRARLYLKDRIAIKNASKSLACICNILARCFSSHLQMKMVCLLSAACISPSNEHFLSVRECLKSSSELVTLQPVAPPGVEWKTYVALWDAVKYLQPLRFHSCTDWEEINPMLRSHFRISGLRYDSLAKVFKNNHNKRGIGCVEVCKNLGQNKIALDRQKAATLKCNRQRLEFNRQRLETARNSTKTLIAKRRDFGNAKKNPGAVSTSSVVKTGYNSRLQKNKADTLRKSERSVRPSDKVSGKVSEKESVDIKQRKELAIQKRSGGDATGRKRKLPSIFKSDNLKKCRRREDSKASFAATKKFCKTQKRPANGEMKLNKSPKTESIFSEDESRGVSDFHCRGHPGVDASPGSSRDSQDTILLDNVNPGLCNSVLSASDCPISDAVNCGGWKEMEGEDTISGNYGDFNDETNDYVDSSKDTIRQNAAEQKVHSVLENEDFLHSSGNWMFQEWSEFSKRAFALEAGESQHGNVDDCLGLELTQNGNAFNSSNLSSHSETSDEDEIPTDVTGSISATDIGDYVFRCHRGKAKQDENYQFTDLVADHRTVLVKKDEKLDECKELGNLTSIVTSTEVSDVENNQTLGCDYSKDPSSLQYSHEHGFVVTGSASRKSFKCSHCSNIYSSIISLQNHMSRIHKVGFACPVCQKLIYSRWGLEVHMNRMHGSEISEQYRCKNTEGFKCRICSKSLPSVFGWRSHMSLSHSVYLVDNPEERHLNSNEVVDIDQNSFIRSEEKAYSSKQDSQSETNKKSLTNGVNKCRRSTSKYRRHFKMNREGGGKLEAGESQHGNVDDCVSLELNKNGNGFRSSSLSSYSEIRDEDEIPMGVKDSNIGDNVLLGPRGKVKDENCQFTDIVADHHTVLVKKDEKLDECKELESSTSIMTSTEMSSVENNQTLGCEYSHEHRFVESKSAPRKTSKYSHCANTYSSEQSLGRHMSGTHKVGFPCPVCRTLIYSRQGREQHIARVHGSEIFEQYRCKNKLGFKGRICSKSLPSEFGWRSHLANSHSAYLVDNPEELGSNYTDVDADQKKDVVRSKAKTSASKQDSQSETSKRSLTDGVSKCHRSTSKYRRNFKANQGEGKLEAGKSQRGNVDDGVSLGLNKNGNGFRSSNFTSHSEIYNEDEFPRDVKNSITPTDIADNVLMCHRGKGKRDENCQFTDLVTDHRTVLVKKDEKLDECKELANSTSVVTSSEVSAVENNQSLSCDYLKDPPSLQYSHKRRFVDARRASKTFASKQDSQSKTDKRSLTNSVRKCHTSTSKYKHKKFKCPYCSSTYSRAISLQQHMSSTHNVGFACPFCQKFVFSRWGRELHIARMHGSKIYKQYRNKSTERFKCQICSKSFTSVFAAHGHLAMSHADYVGGNDKGHSLNYIEVDVDQSKEVIRSEAKAYSSKQDSQSETSKRSLTNGVNKRGRSTSKYKQNFKTNHKGGGNLFKLESPLKKLVRRKASIVVGLKDSRNSLRSCNDSCPELPLESPTVNGSELRVEENSARSSDVEDISESVCSVVNSSSSEDVPCQEFNVVEQPVETSCDLNAVQRETDVPVSDRTTLQNGLAVSKYLHLKNCCVRLKRLCLSKIKLRECRVTVERLSLEQIADRESDAVQLLHLDCQTPLEPQNDLQNKTTARRPMQVTFSLDPLRAVEEQGIHVNSSPIEVPPLLSEPITNKEVSDGQATVQNDRMPDALSSKTLAVGECMPSPGCKTSSDASLKMSLAADAVLAAVPSSSSSSLCTPIPVTCPSCPTVANDSQKLSKIEIPTGVSVVDILRSTGSILFGTEEQINRDDCLEKLCDSSSSSTEVEEEPGDTMKEVRKLPLCHQLQDFRSARHVNSEEKSDSLPSSNVTEHLMIDCKKVSRRKRPVRRRTFSAIEGARRRSKPSSFGRQQDRRARFGNGKATNVHKLKAETSQVKLVPFSVLDLGVSNMSNADSSSSDLVSKARPPERKTVRKNLFESFEENIIRSVMKKTSSQNCSQQTKSRSKRVFDSDSKSPGKPPEIIRRLRNQQRICKTQATKAMSILLKDKFMHAVPATSGSTKVKDSLSCADGTTKSRDCSGLVERIERVAVPVCFSKSSDDSWPVVDQLQLTGAVECMTHISASGSALRGLYDSEDVCVISSDEEVQVIDLDDMDSCHSSDSEGSRVRQKRARRTKDWARASRQRVLANGRSSRARYSSLANSTVLANGNIYCCDQCPKSFTDNELLMKHKSCAHGQYSLSRSLSERMHRPVETKSSVGRFSFYGNRSRHVRSKIFGCRDGQPGFCAQKSLC